MERDAKRSIRYPDFVYREFTTLQDHKLLILMTRKHQSALYERGPFCADLVSTLEFGRQLVAQRNRGGNTT